MNFKAIIAHIFSFDGALNRKQYIILTLSTAISATLAARALGNIFWEGEADFVIALMMIALFVSFISGAIRRLRDLSFNPFISVLILVPYVNLATMLALAVMPGNGQAATSSATGSGRKQYKTALLSPVMIPLIGMMAKMAKADGIVEPREIAVVNNFFKYVLRLNNDERAEAQQLFNELKDAPYKFSDFAKQYYNYFISDQGALNAAFGLMLEIALTKPQLGKDESALLEEAARIFSIDTAQYNAHDSWKDGNNGGSSYGGGAQSVKKYADILGVSEDCTAAELKKAYHKLMSQNHPDRVAHMSEAIRKAAEEECKKINEAYQALKDIRDKTKAA